MELISLVMVQARKNMRTRSTGIRPKLWWLEQAQATFGETSLGPDVRWCR